MTQFKVSKFKGKEYISFSDNELVDLLKKIILDSRLFGDEDDIKIETSLFRSHWRNISMQCETNPVLKPLNEFLLKNFKNEIKKFNNLLESNLLSFEDVPNFFIVGHTFKVKTHEDYYAVEVVEVNLSHCGDLPSYQVKCKYIDQYDKLDYHYHNFYIQNKPVPINIDTLEATPVSEFEKEAMRKRGLRALEYINKPFVFCNLKGSMKIRCSSVNCSGRVIVDNKLYHNREDDEPLQCKEEIEDQIEETIDFTGKEHLIYPFVGVYSLEKKTWGLVHIDKLSPITFSENAFENVVMNPERKRIIRKIVTTYMQTDQIQPKFDDFVTNKNGGLIFLLHGLPGLGKTLIAESTAEYVKAPLLQITAGELGIYPDEIESSLQNKFQVAKRWNAIVLIDEADVFMEQRSSNDIKRNAMVTIFLRMLERFDGILFLTTNRGDNLDIAIKSRLSIILDYKPFTKEERQLVWKNIINRQSKTIQFELSEDDLEQLSTKQLNGREIKHLVKMSIALSENNKITLEDVNSVLKYIHTE